VAAVVATGERVVSKILDVVRLELLAGPQHRNDGRKQGVHEREQ
jgi:hypothetical protein